MLTMINTSPHAWRVLQVWVLEHKAGPTLSEGSPAWVLEHNQVYIKNGVQPRPTLYEIYQLPESERKPQHYEDWLKLKIISQQT